MKTYSRDLRERIIEGKESGEGTQELAKRYKVAVRTVQKYWQRYRKDGEIEGRQRGGYRRDFLEGHDAALERWIKLKDDISLAELQRRCLEELKVRVGLSTVWRRIRKLGLSYKKNDARFRTGAARHQGSAGSMAAGSKRVGRPKADLP